MKSEGWRLLGSAGPAKIALLGVSAKSIIQEVVVSDHSKLPFSYLSFKNNSYMLDNICMWNILLDSII